MQKILAVVLSVASTFAFGQAVPTSKLGWDQVAPTAAEAQGYAYHYYGDADQVGVLLTGVTCGGAASPFSCQANFPAFTPGAHTMAITAANAAGKSARSGAMNFTFVVVPAVPTNLRVQ